MAGILDYIKGYPKKLRKQAEEGLLGQRISPMTGGILVAGALDPLYPAIQDMAKDAGPKIANYYNTRAGFLDKLGQQYGADYTTPRLSEGAGENIALAAGSLASPVRSKAVMNLINKAKSMGMTSQKKITDFVNDHLKGGVKQDIKTTRRLIGKYDPKTSKWNQYPGVDQDSVLQNIDARYNQLTLGYDPDVRNRQEDLLNALGVKLPDSSNPQKYKDNLRAMYRYWNDDEWRMEVLSKHSQNQSLRRDAKREMIEKSGTQELPENMQREMASDRVRSVIRNMRLSDEERGGGFYLSKEEIEKLRDQLYPIKLKEIQEGTPLIYRMTIDHYYPRHGVVSRGGEQIGAGVTTWGNITDSKGKLRLVSFLDNIRKADIIPGRLLDPVQKEFRKYPTGTSIMDI